MRIIAGSRGGRMLVDWEASGIRPMRDFVRAALFSILSDFVEGASFLDLYCGTGSVGLEALSRGARSCTFVDRSREACAIVRRNLDGLGLLDVGEVINGDAVATIGAFARRAHTFDLVFVGPPYYHEFAPTTLDSLADGRILGADPVIVTEIHQTETAADRYGILRLSDHRRYGDNRLLFYRTDADVTSTCPSDEGAEEKS